MKACMDNRHICITSDVYIPQLPAASRSPKRLLRVQCRNHAPRLQMPIRALQNTSSSSPSLMFQSVLLLRAFIATNNPPATLCLGLKLCRRGSLPSALLRLVPAIVVLTYVKDGTVFDPCWSRPLSRMRRNA
jgi:hypothetical protein